MSNWRNTPAATAIRTGLHITRDKLTGRKATGLEDVPWSVSAITDQWWSAVLCKNSPGAEVVSSKIVSASSGTHQRHCFAIEYNQTGKDAGLPTSIFTKTLPTVVTRMMGGFNGTSYMEGRFLTEIRPDIDIESPMGYHTALDRNTLAGINVLEDLVATKNATFCDFKTYVDRGMAEEMVDLLATLHAHRYNDSRLESELRWVANFYDWFTIGSQKMRTEHYTQQSLDKAADVTPKQLLEQRSQLWPATIAAAEIHRSGPRGLLHSDVHIGNWYQTGDGHMGLCDWQCLTQGHWSRDLAYALSAGLEIEDRRNWEKPLLERYLARMASLTQNSFDWDESWRHYRSQMLHALWMWTITLCHSPMLPAMQTEDTSRKMIERIATAVVDLNSIQEAQT